MKRYAKAKAATTTAASMTKAKTPRITCTMVEMKTSTSTTPTPLTTTRAGDRPAWRFVGCNDTPTSLACPTPTLTAFGKIQ